MEKTNGASGAKKTGMFKNVKSEFSKIIWADKQTVAKQSVAVIVITAILSVVIALLDAGIIELLDKVLKIG